MRRNLLAKYKQNSLARGITFAISDAHFFKLLGSDCTYCSAPPTTSAAKWLCCVILDRDFKLNGIDRVDNTKGYVKGNVAACCSKCNYIERSMSIKELYLHVIKMLPNLRKLTGKKR